MRSTCETGSATAPTSRLEPMEWASNGGAQPARRAMLGAPAGQTRSWGCAMLDGDRSTPPNAGSSVSAWRPSGGLVSAVALIAIPGLLFIPILSYSLNTPFALVDDYYDWTWVDVLEDRERLSQWFYERFLTFQNTESRHRPFFELYNMLAWKTFGPTPWLHHLSRWVLHFAPVFAFAAAFLAFPGSRQSPAFRLIPLALLVYLWLFFPNSPASRLAPQEVYSVLFLGLCTWMVALMLLGKDDGRGPTATLKIHGLFFLGFLGLALSKETNIAVMAWMLAFYCVLLFVREAPGKSGGGWKCIPLILVFLHLLVKVSRDPWIRPA